MFTSGLKGKAPVSKPRLKGDRCGFERGWSHQARCLGTSERANSCAMASWEEAASAPSMAALVGKRVHRSTGRGAEEGTVVLYDMERGLYKVRRRSKGAKTRTERSGNRGTRS